MTNPISGQPILLWAQGVTDAVNALTGIGPARGLVRSGLGAGVEPLPENKRTGGSISALAPFTVRHVVQAAYADGVYGIPYTGWEVYIPAGCVNVGSSATPLNRPAERIGENGEPIVLDGWYVVSTCYSGLRDDSASAAIFLHVKPLCVDDSQPASVYRPQNRCWIDAIPVDNNDNPRNYNGTWYYGDCGDALKVRLGRARITNTGSVSDPALAYDYDQYVSTPIYLADYSPSVPFSIAWHFTVENWSAYNAYLALAENGRIIRNAAYTAGGVSYEMTSSGEPYIYAVDNSTQKIYLKIRTDTSPHVATVEEDYSVASLTDFEILILIYSFVFPDTTKNVHLAIDNRAALQSIQVFR